VTSARLGAAPAANACVGITARLAPRADKTCLRLAPCATTPSDEDAAKSCELWRKTLSLDARLNEAAGPVETNVTNSARSLLFLAHIILRDVQLYIC
jgi:hypothetical protein